MKEFNNLINSLEKYDLTNAKNVVKLIIDSGVCLNNKATSNLKWDELREELYRQELLKQGVLEFYKVLETCETIVNKTIEQLEYE